MPEGAAIIALSTRRWFLGAAAAVGLAAVVGEKPVVRFFKAFTQGPPPPPAGLLPTGSDVYSVAFSPDGRTLASGNGDATVWLWRVTDPARPVALGRPLSVPTDSVSSVAFSPHGHTLAAGGGNHSTSTIQLWDVTDPARPVALGQPLTSPTAGVNSVAFSPDGHTLASGSDLSTVQLWDVTDPARAVALGQPLL